MSGQKGEVVIKKEAGVNVVTPLDHDVLDDSEIVPITAQLSSIRYDDLQPKLVLDLQNVEYISSAGLSMLVSIDRRCKGRNGRLVLVNIRQQIMEVLQHMRLDGLIEIQATVADAMKQLTGT